VSKSEQRSWLVADDDVRRRLLDIEPIIGRAHRGSVVAILAVVPFIARGRGIWLVGVGVSYALAVLALEATVRHSRRAEYPIIAKTILSLATLAVVALLTGGPNSPALLLLVVSIVPASARSCCSSCRSSQPPRALTYVASRW
jgi:hypothetical protein